MERLPIIDLSKEQALFIAGNVRREVREQSPRQNAALILAQCRINLPSRRQRLCKVDVTGRSSLKHWDVELKPGFGSRQKIEPLRDHVDRFTMVSFSRSSLPQQGHRLDQTREEVSVRRGICHQLLEVTNRFAEWLRCGLRSVGLNLQRAVIEQCTSE